MVRSSWYPSARLPITRRSRLSLASARMRADRAVLKVASFVVLQQRKDVVARKLLTSSEKGQLHHETDADHCTAEFGHHARGGSGGTARSQKIVHDQDAFALVQSILMHLQRVGSVFQIVGDAGKRGGQFLGLA